MAADDLPRKFDVIVVGTGLLESIIAAAFSRVGHTVLHIDRNDYYCGDWASFNLHGLDEWCAEQQSSHPDPLERPESDEVDELKEGDILVECPLYGKTHSNIETGFLVGDKELEQSTSVDEPDKPVVGPCGDSSTCTTCPAAPETSPDVAPSDTQCPADVSNEHRTTESSITEQCPVPSDDNTEAIPCLTDTNSTNQTTSTTADARREDIKEEVPTETENCQNNIKDVPKTENRTDSELCDSKTTSACKSQSEPADGTDTKVWTKSDIQKEWRKFNIDLAPRLLYCRGDMVELLINSDVSKYCEFKTVTRVLTNLNEELQKVPCSRADVFSSKSVSMIEKRMMMKFITFCMDYQKHPEEYQAFLDKPFTEFLDSRRLKPNIRHFIQHSIAMATDTTTTLEGLEKTQKFILSLGRYGNTAFLWPLYGTGELPQSYARMCAVFGGIYCLRMTASSIIVDEENKYRGIITTEGHRIESKWLISETSYLPKQYLPTGYGSRLTSRAVLLTDKSIQQADSEQLTLLHLPCPDDSNRPVTVLELGPSSMACPQGLYLVHLSRQGTENTCTAREDLQYAVDLLFSDTESKPSFLWYLYFSQSNTQGLVSECPENIVTIPGPGSELDMDHVVKQARDIFTKLCPDEEFLPKAPNPEDIIFDDGMCREASEGFQAPSADHSGDSPDQQITDENSPGDKPPESSGNSETAEPTDSERNNQAETRTKADGTAQSEITSDTPAEETTNSSSRETAEVSTT